MEVKRLTADILIKMKAKNLSLISSSDEKCLLEEFDYGNSFCIFFDDQLFHRVSRKFFPKDKDYLIKFYDEGLDENTMGSFNHDSKVIKVYIKSLLKKYLKDKDDITIEKLLDLKNASVKTLIHEVTHAYRDDKESSWNKLRKKIIRFSFEHLMPSLYIIIMFWLVSLPVYNYEKYLDSPFSLYASILIIIFLVYQIIGLINSEIDIRKSTGKSYGQIFAYLNCYEERVARQNENEMFSNSEWQDVFVFLVKVSEDSCSEQEYVAVL